jgi:hypothetical protein
MSFINHIDVTLADPVADIGQARNRYKIEDGNNNGTYRLTHYGLEGPGIESRWGEIFRTSPDRLRRPPSLLYNGYRVFPGGKGSRGVMLTTHPLLVPRLRKG